ncbi:DUF2590 family protein [Pseudoalteromonas sp. S1608]|uniref:DUF2590 family protein n=1 Tax=Pseudoalteromonas sp. S1608 TaxID=579504 RepID=UPI00110B9446|nr:DUF2590 family protein [Pseudoalteromonas sp. S1608]TMP73537.1 hypothetical protein CWB75_14260 [Pseudoalteromonas sp. S1608]
MIHIDLNVVDRDLSFDEVLTPAQLTKSDVISQDIKHRLLESGLPFLLIGQRNINSIKMVLTEVELIVEQDDRLVPGTIQVFYGIDKSIKVLAQTKDYGQEAGN